MDYEWDERTASLNLRKHGVDFADAIGVFDDETAVTVPDTSADEERLVTLGSDFLGRLLVVVYTWRDERIRIISARRATPTKRTEYED